MRRSPEHIPVAHSHSQHIPVEDESYLLYLTQEAEARCPLFPLLETTQEFNLTSRLNHSSPKQP